MIGIQPVAATVSARIADARATRLRAELTSAGTPAALLFAPDNVRFATGHYGSMDLNLQHPERWALVFSDSPAIVWEHPSRRSGNASGADESIEVRTGSGWDWLGPPSNGGEPFVSAILHALHERDAHRGPLAIDNAPASVFVALESARVELREACDILARSRLIKGKDEIAGLRLASRVCRAALNDAADDVAPGRWMSEIWRAFERSAIARGAEVCAPPDSGDYLIADAGLVVLDARMIGPGGFVAHLAETYLCDGCDGADLVVAHSLLRRALDQCRPGVEFSALRHLDHRITVHGCGVAADSTVMAESPVVTDCISTSGRFAYGMVVSVGVELTGSEGRAVAAREQIVITPGGYEILGYPGSSRDYARAHTSLTTGTATIGTFIDE